MTVKFNQMAGIIDKEDEQRFKRIIFRVTKGNVWLNLEDVDENLLLPNEQILNVENVKYKSK
jgi:V-type H+-transporting ATPase subunit a